MFYLTKTSKIILKNQKLFEYKNVIFAGDIIDKIPVYLKTINSIVYTKKYSYWNDMKKYLKNKIFLNFIFYKKYVFKCNTLIYFWPKNKLEAIFELKNITSLLPIGFNIFIVGESKNGVKSSKKMLENIIEIKKIDNARNCILNHGIIKKKIKFKISDFLNIYVWNNIKIASLPGVFGFNKIDEGSELLASTFRNNFIKGNVLDIGCGNGILSTSILQQNHKLIKNILLIDDNLTSIVSSKNTLKINNLKGTVFPSNVYSNIKYKNFFDLIVSNPPIHIGLRLNFKIITKIIKYSKHYLKFKGELRIVVNKSFSCKRMPHKNFSILKQNEKFIVYQIINQ
ncbi:Ribosomal RNA small subunit methyltransferase C [Buchnera aphidicola (Neophyllaphis podocarpi)]|uniref:16S rRNA (guanine(1207)-N(2))-methyltransferase RsmC n=1 Tax=Buchnera aphidicola TaxID=9 RepID=UPI003464754A